MSKIENEVKNEEGKNTLPEKKEKINTEVVKNESDDNSIDLQTFDLTGDLLPDLNDKFAKALPIDLRSGYWTPLKEDEEKRVFFQELGYRDTLNEQTGELEPLLYAFFVEQLKDGSLKSISNASKILVGTIEARNLKYGTPLLIIYRGKTKNKKNIYSSDDWSVFPMTVNVNAK